MNEKSKAPAKYNRIAALISYESGYLDEEQEIELFQDLLDSGIIYGLQGHYGRQAKALLDAGYISKNN